MYAALGAGGRRIGDAHAPADTTRPYAVLYPLYVGGRDGPDSDWQADGWYEYQVTSVGDTRMQAEGLADELRVRLLASTLTVNGFATGPINLSDDVGVERDDDVQPPIYYTIQMYSIFATPDVTAYTRSVTEPVGVTDSVTTVP